jgi:predicted permease
MRFWDWFLRRRREDDLQDEIRAHLSMAVQDRIASGEDPAHAHRASLKEFGNVTLTREAARQSWGGAWRDRVAEFAQDIRFSVRVLLRSPGYALVVIAVLALGIGANVSVFSLFNALALKPIPGVDGSASLGVLVSRTGAGRILPLSNPDFRDMQRELRSFEQIAGTSMEAFTIGFGLRAERQFAELVTGNYFQVLGVSASLGRTLGPSDDVAPGKHPVAVISDDLWRRAFGSDPAAVGPTIKVDGFPLTIVGVVEPGFRGTIPGLALDVFIPVQMAPQLRGVDLLAVRKAPMLWGIGHLRSGIAAADSEAGTLWTRLAALHDMREVDQRAAVIPMWSSPFGAQTYMLPALGLMGLMGVLLLLVVCANVSNLVLARGVTRRGEIAARIALGASRGRILRLLVAESLVLALPGAALGMAVARGLGVLLRNNNVTIAGGPRPFLDASPDVTVAAFALLLSCGAALVFGLVPALRSTRVNLAGIMKDDLSPRGGSRGRLRDALVVAQVAVSLLLLVGTALVVRSLRAAETADTGFDSRNVASVSIDVKPNGYDDDRGRVFYRRLLDTVRADPDVESAALASDLLLTLVEGSSDALEIDGVPARRGEDRRAPTNAISADYFRTLRIPVLAGRDFSRTDTPDVRPVVIVNETMARRFWTTSAQALGQRLRLNNGPWRFIVGVVRDIKYARVTEDPHPYVYLPLDQVYQADLTLHVRGRGAAGLLVRAQNLVHAVDADLPILTAQMLRDQTAVALTIFTMVASILMAFGVIAIILTALGTYGLVSYAVSHSTHEIGIRLAIGAGRGEVLRRFLTRGLRLGVVGTAVGVVAAGAAARALSSLLYGVSATDAVSFSSAVAVVIAVVLGASLVPAWRASRTDPIAALRHR